MGNESDLLYTLLVHYDKTKKGTEVPQSIIKSKMFIISR